MKKNDAKFEFVEDRDNYQLDYAVRLILYYI